MIDQYKTSKDSLIIKTVPNKLYCYAGYWFEKANPGTFESIFYTRSKKVINEFKDEVDGILNDITSEYKAIKKEFNNLFQFLKVTGLMFSRVRIKISKKVFYSTSKFSAESEQILTLNQSIADQLYSW